MSNYSIALTNQQSIMRIDRRRLLRQARSVLAMEEVAIAEISVAVVDDRQIHALNRRFLKHDCPTDVISFLLDSADWPARASSANRRPGVKATYRTSSPLPREKRRTNGRPSRIVRRGAGKVIGGEVVLSAETALRTAGDYGTRPADELALYLVHGLLHLCGYDDLTPREKRLMRRREAEALQDWNAGPRRRTGTT